MKLLNIRKTLSNLALTAIALLTGIGSVTAQDNSLLYKIEGNGIQPSYLYGTIHLMPPADFKIKDKVNKAFDESELIVLELDMDDPGLMGTMMSKMALESDMSLDKIFEKDEYAKVDAALKEITGVGIAPLNKMKPLIISQMLILKYVGAQPASYEASFVQMAKEKEKEILGLETVEEQMQIFNNIPYEDQADDIMEMIEDEEGTKDMFQEMVDTYKAEDITEMYDLMSTYFGEDEGALDNMLHSRNNKWIPKIGEFAKKQSTFFGVGAGHLGGDEGVVSLLRKAGYTLTPIVD